MLPTYAASSNEDPVKFWKRNQSDNQIACSIHPYIPYHFAQSGEKIIYDQNQSNELKNILNRIKNYILDKGNYVIFPTIRRHLSILRFESSTVVS